MKNFITSFNLFFWFCTLLLLSQASVAFAAKPKVPEKDIFSQLCAERDSLVALSDSLSNRILLLDSWNNDPSSLPVVTTTIKNREELDNLKRNEDILSAQLKERSLWMERYLPNYISDLDSILNIPLPSLSPLQVENVISDILPFRDNKEAASLLDKANDRQVALNSLSLLRTAINSPLSPSDLKNASDNFNNLRKSLSPLEISLLDSEIGVPLSSYSDAVSLLKQLASDYQHIEKVQKTRNNPPANGSEPWKVERSKLLKHFNSLLDSFPDLPSIVEKVPFTAHLFLEYRQCINANPLVVSSPESQILDLWEN